MTNKPDSAYVFDLHLVCGGYAYFSTFTGWNGENDGSRFERRRPDRVNVRVFEQALNALGLSAYLIDTQPRYERWIRMGGWAIVPVPFAQAQMSQWLKHRECMKDAAQTFTDVTIASDKAKSRNAGGGIRKDIRTRDGGICLRCGRGEEDGVSLTMHHVTPSSAGGETTTRNLVLVCEECNQAIGTSLLSELYELAGLPHGYELRLLRDGLTADSFRWVTQISTNLMHTRCELW